MNKRFWGGGEFGGGLENSGFPRAFFILLALETRRRTIQGQSKPRGKKEERVLAPPEISFIQVLFQDDKRIHAS
ncbi:hypothetical protein VNO77_33702 [Canavalia gladiata]|uniref:Uncharacterized protein n=1 Tax=Canavalia gladiata TaxID=3824 RepID=A0AAN9PZ60_CANGL